MRTKIRLFFETTNHFHKYLLVHITFNFVSTAKIELPNIKKRLPNKRVGNLFFVGENVLKSTFNL